MKHWIIRNGFDDGGYINMIESIIKLGYTHELVDYIPFSEEYDLSHIDLNNTVVYGGQGLLNYAKRMGYKGVFFNDNFDVLSWQNHWGNELLNYDSIVSTIEKMNPTIDRFFIRPLHDNKKFSGQLMDLEEFNGWKAKVMGLDPNDFSTIDRTTEIVISTVKKIIAEYRTIVVNGKFVTGSEYKRGDKVCYHHFVPEYVIDYVNKMSSIWCPDTAFCLDIAEVYQDNEYVCKIIEVNCVNGIGLYLCDTDKYVHSLSECF